MTSAISNFLQHSPLLDNTSTALCALASLEMGCRTIIDLSSRAERRDNLSANLSGTLLFGLSAANLFPGTRKLAALGFIIRSFSVFLRKPETAYRKEEYYIGRCITFFPDRSYQGYKWVKSQLNLPSHPSWYLLIGLISLIGYHQFGGNVYKYFGSST